MSCLTAEAHINIILLCPPGLMTQDTVHLISCQQMAGSLIVPITHQRQFQGGAVISAPDTRWGWGGGDFSLLLIINKLRKWKKNEGILCTNLWKCINKGRWSNMLSLIGNIHLVGGASDHYSNPREGEYLGEMGIPGRLIWALLTSASFVG